MKTLNNVEFKNSDSYLKDLLKSLSNFCSKSPLSPTIKVFSDLGKIYIYYDDTYFDFDIDINKNKKEVIKYVKQKLEKNYPIIYIKENKLPSADEVEKMIDNGKTIQEALECTTVEWNPKYMIKRVHNIFNELDLFDLKEKVIYKYKSKIPVIMLLEELKRDETYDIMSNLTLLYRMDNQR